MGRYGKRKVSEIAVQIKALGVSAQEYVADIDRLVEEFPLFETPELAEVATALKRALIEVSSMTMSVVKLALNADETREMIQGELDRGSAIVEALQAQLLFVMLNAKKMNQAPIHSQELEALREELESERRARNAADRRAEDAENTAASLRQQLFSNTIDHRDQVDSPEWGGTTPQPHDAALSFPYETKELLAMRDAALKYWAGYTRDKRQPTQNEVQLELCELLGLSIGKGSTPPRKTIALAGAIKPDSLPEA